MRVKIGDFLKPVRNSTTIQSDVDYKQVTVRMNNQGVCLRGIKKGSEIKTKKQFLVEPGQFILSKIDARNGAFGLVPEDLAGAIVTQDFPTYSINQQIIDKDYLVLMSSSGFFVDLMRQSSSGTTNRKRLKEEKFLNIEIELPELAEQIETVNYLKKVTGSLLMTKKSIEQNNGLLPEIFAKLFLPYSQIKEKAVLSDLVKFIDYRGKTPTKTSSGIPLVTAKNIKFGFFSEEPREYVSEEDYERWMTRGFPTKGDILITTEAPLGNICFVPNHTFALAQRAICLHLTSRVNPDYLFFYLMSPEFQTKLINLSTGTTAKGIKASKLKQIQIPIPEIKKQIQIAEQINGKVQKYKRIRMLTSELDKKSNLIRNSLVNQRIRNV